MGPAPRTFLKALVLAAACVASAEGAVRLVLGDQGREWQYWETQAAATFEPFRLDVERGVYPALIVVGDSTAASNIAAARLGAALNMRAYNLAWPGTFPLAFRDCVLPLLRDARGVRLVVAGFIPGGFADQPAVRRFEQTVVSSAFCRAIEGHPSLGDRVHLARAWAILHWKYRASARESGSGDRAGATTARNGGQGVDTTDDKTRLADLAREWIGQGNLGEPIAPTAERIAVLHQLAELGDRGGFRVVFVMPPLWGSNPASNGPVDRLVASVKALASTDRRLTVLDYHHAGFLTDSHYHDLAHLTEEGADIFTRVLAGDLGRLR